MRITFVGDIALSRANYLSFKYDDRVKELFNNSDYVIGNLECPITRCTNKKPLQAINLSADKESLRLIDGVDIVSLANNHIQDYGNEGIFDTIDAISERKIRYFGIGRNEQEALAPFIFGTKSLKIAIIGATRYANAKLSEWGTSSDTSPLLFSNIQKLKKEGYFVIVYFHWGYEYVRIPSPRERRIAHKTIDCGADFVVGSHPHVFQGIEQYNGKTIVYSLGNFIFHSSLFYGMAPDSNDDRLFNSFIVSIDIKGNMEYSYNIFDYSISDNGISLCSDDSHHKFIEELTTISNDLKGKNYLANYYKQSYAISRQNVKIREEYQKASSLTPFQRLSLYRNANFQDACNRLAGFFISIYRKHK